MREIKFRGTILFGDDQGRWIAGDLEHFTALDGREMVRIRHEIGHKEIVIPETVGQYTGQKDPNGMEIYEGDVVSCSTFRGVVKYNSYTASFQAVSAGWWPISLEYDKHDPFEVIGNIFDDPELNKQFGEVYRKEQ